jgi:hypothetical protein
MYTTNPAELKLIIVNDRKIGTLLFGASEMRARSIALPL